MVAAERQQAERRTGGFNPTHLLAAAPDGWTALAGAVLSLAINDCQTGDASACAWLITGPGRRMLSLLLPSAADEAALYQRLRMLAPDAVQLSMFETIGAST